MRGLPWGHPYQPPCPNDFKPLIYRRYVDDTFFFWFLKPFELFVYVVLKWL